MSVVISALLREARRHPQREAVTGSRSSLTWGELETEVARLATVLTNARALATLLVNSPAWVVTDLAALQVAVTHVPLPPFFSDAQLGHALADAGIDTVITDDPDRIQALVTVRERTTLVIAGREYTRLGLQVAGRKGQGAVAKITYTSGTTGTPRGVRLSLETIETVAGALARAAEATPDDRAMALLPLSILLENIGTVLVPVLCGARIVVPDPAETGIAGSSRVDAARLAQALQHYRPSALIVPPGLLKLLTGLARAGSLPATLRFIAVGGAPVGRALLDEAAACGLPVYQGYGLSEASSVVALNTPSDNRPGSVGRLLPHLRARLNENGEILVQGRTYSGYLGATARNPASELATGDTGYFDDDGYLYVTGRLRERIITSYGRNVSPEWVEAELMAQPGVAQAAVTGDGQAGLRAVLVPAGDDPSALGKAVSAVNARLPDYARVDTWVAATVPFTVASGQATAGGSPRRAVIEQRYFPQRQAARS